MVGPRRPEGDNTIRSGSWGQAAHTLPEAPKGPDFPQAQLVVVPHTARQHQWHQLQQGSLHPQELCHTSIQPGAFLLLAEEQPASKPRVSLAVKCSWSSPHCRFFLPIHAGLSLGCVNDPSGYSTKTAFLYRGRTPAGGGRGPACPKTLQEEGKAKADCTDPCIHGQQPSSSSPSH